MAELLDQWKLALAMASDPALSRGDIACGMHLIEAFNPKAGCAWPSYETLAERASIHRSNALRSIARLVERGYFEKGVGGGRGRSNTYRPCFERVAPTLPTESVAPARPIEPETVAPTHINSSAGAHKQSRPRYPNVPMNLPMNLPRDVVDVAGDMWAIFSEELGEVLPVPRKLTEARRAAARKRLQEDLDGDLNAWRSLCRKVRSTPFLTGAGERGWKADWDWLLKPANLLKVIEGKYDAREAQPKRSPLMAAFDDLERGHRNGRKAAFADEIARMHAEGQEPDAKVLDGEFFEITPEPGDRS